MASEAPIEWELGLKKPSSEVPIEEQQPDLKKPKLESAEEDLKKPKSDSEEEEEEDSEDEYPIEEDEDEDDEFPIENVGTEEDGQEYWRNDKLYADNENGLHEMNPKECGEYYYHLHTNGGFDMPVFPNAIHYGIQPADLSDAWEYVDVKNCSIFATQKHNEKKGTNYEYYRIVKVNSEIVSGSIYYITFLAEDLNGFDSGSGSLEKVPVGLNGGPLVELQAKVYLPIPENAKKKLRYFHVKDTLSEEGLKAHMQYQAHLERVATK